MGSEVAEGFICKPKKLDPQKPIMHFKTQIFLCDDERCGSVGDKELAKNLRELTKELNLDRGEERIKISRSFCYGACRYRKVAQIIENTNHNGDIKNNNIFLSHTHKYSLKEWKELFLLLQKGEDLKAFKQIEMKVF
jgi:cobalt-precorrin 5A hydrolase